MPDGQDADFRLPVADGRGLHLKLYDDCYLMHWDEVAPSVNPVGHLVQDAPEVVIGAVILGAALQGSSSESVEL